MVSGSSPDAPSIQMDAKKIVAIQQRQIRQLTELVDRLVSVMDRQTDAIGKLVAIAMTPNEGDDAVEQADKPRYLDPADEPR